MNKKRSSLQPAIALALALFLMPVGFAIAQAIQVNGTIIETVVEHNVRAPLGVEVTAFDEVDGDLAGQGVVHIFSSDFVNPTTELNVISARSIFTSEGNLFLSEVGERVGDNTHVVSTVIGGTGIFIGASGQLVLNGVLTHPGIFFTYGGTILFAP